jgi:DNA-binding NarL/FixJ family response regulator
MTTLDNSSPSVGNSNGGRRKVLIVDDHPAFRYGMIRLLKQLNEFDVCGEAGDGMAALEIFRQVRPHIVLMDISLPGRDGVELTKMMLSDDPKLTVLVVSMHDESNYALRALRAGAKGYLRKDESLTELGTALQRIASHGLYVSQRFSDRIVFKAIQSGEELGESYLRMLSDRELEVFRAIGHGLGTREIAEKLCLSIKTIETHRAHIKRKLQAGDGNEVVKLARDLQNFQESA